LSGKEVTYAKLMMAFAKCPRPPVEDIEETDSDEEEGSEERRSSEEAGVLQGIPGSNGGSTSLFKPVKVAVEGRTSPRRVRGEGGGMIKGGDKREMISPELMAFYKSISVPEEVYGRLVGESILYIEDIKPLGIDQLRRMGVPSPFDSKIANCARCYRASSNAAKQVMQSQARTVRRDQALYAERREPSLTQADVTIHTNTFALYQSAGWGSRPSSAASSRQGGFNAAMRPQSAPAGRGQHAQLKAASRGNRGKNLKTTDPFAWQRRAREEAEEEKRAAKEGRRRRPATSGPAGRSARPMSGRMSSVMEEAHQDLGGDDDGEIEMIGDEDMDELDMDMDEITTVPDSKHADRVPYEGVAYQSKERPGEGDGTATVAENLIAELKQLV